MLTGVSLPVKVVLGIAVAAKVNPRLLAGGAVSKGHMPVGNVVEELDLVLVEQQTGRNGVHRGITPALIKETAITVKGLKKVNVRVTSKPFQAANLKVGPLHAC